MITSLRGKITKLFWHVGKLIFYRWNFFLAGGKIIFAGGGEMKVSNTLLMFDC